MRQCSVKISGGSLSLSEERDRPPLVSDLKSSLAPSSSSLNTPKLSQQTSSQEVSMEESETGVVAGGSGASGGGIVCLSTASLASTSSSSSSEPRYLCLNVKIELRRRKDTTFNSFVVFTVLFHIETI
ncbi:uncharacterized protein LOC120352150 [Nilaparvata lugens]|uniref:uncharacterized protein LOC120352150 n=1 Tax=Nilaparvata lugens TaxID=108931 RepID=UPI00193E2E0C|nr:uncharacterized protein LOC120352150 [Nilaparvata lugens]